jgi:hypothetical protein
MAHDEIKDAAAAGRAGASLWVEPPVVVHRALTNSQPGQAYTTQTYLDFTAADSIPECGNNTTATYWNT